MIKISHIIINPRNDDFKNEQDINMSIRWDNIVAHYVDEQKRSIVIVKGLDFLRTSKHYQLKEYEHMIVDSEHSNLELLHRFMMGRADSIMWEVLTELRYNPAFGSQMANIRDSFSKSAEGLRKKNNNEDD